MTFFRKAADSPPSKVLIVGVLSPVRTLDPRECQDVVSTFAMMQVFETPCVPPHDDRIAEPLLIEEAPRPEGSASTFVAQVRSGLHFSDGTELSARHVAESLTGAESFRQQARVTVNGAQLRFELERPNPRFDLVLSNVYSCIVLESDGQRFGTGAYQVAEGSTPEAFRLIKNPHYRKPVPIDEVVFRYYPPSASGSPDDLVAAIERGEVDFTTALSRDDVAGLKEVRKWFQPGISTAALYFNTQKPALSDPRVRRALALAVDRPALTRLSYENALAFTATSLLPPMMGSWRDGLRHNLDQARQLLQESGARLGRLRLQLPWGPRPYLPHPRRTADALAEQLRELGVELEMVENRDSSQFYDHIARSDFDLTLVGWIADTADPADFLEVNLSSRTIPVVGKSPAIRANMAHFADAETDAALDAYRAERSDANKLRVLERVRDAVPLLPIMYGPTIAVHSWKLKGFEPVAIGYPMFADLDLD